MSPSPSPKAKDQFYRRLHEMIEAAPSLTNPPAVQWGLNGKGLIIRDNDSFMKYIIPKFFDDIKQKESLTRRFNRNSIYMVRKGPEKGTWHLKGEKFFRGSHGVVCDQVQAPPEPQQLAVPQMMSTATTSELQWGQSFHPVQCRASPALPSNDASQGSTFMSTCNNNCNFQMPATASVNTNAGMSGTVCNGLEHGSWHHQGENFFHNSHGVTGDPNAQTLSQPQLAAPQMMPTTNNGFERLWAQSLMFAQFQSPPPPSSATASHGSTSSSTDQSHFDSQKPAAVKTSSSSPAAKKVKFDSSAVPPKPVQTNLKGYETVSEVVMDRDLDAFFNDLAYSITDDMLKGNHDDLSFVETPAGVVLAKRPSLKRVSVSDENLDKYTWRKCMEMSRKRKLGGGI